MCGVSNRGPCLEAARCRASGRRPGARQRPTWRKSRRPGARHAPCRRLLPEISRCRAPGRRPGARHCAGPGLGAPAFPCCFFTTTTINPPTLTHKLRCIEELTQGLSVGMPNIPKPTKQINGEWGYSVSACHYWPHIGRDNHRLSVCDLCLLFVKRVLGSYS